MKTSFDYRPGRFGYRRPAAPRLSVTAAENPAPAATASRPLRPLPALPQVA